MAVDSSDFRRGIRHGLEDRDKSASGNALVGREYAPDRFVNIDGDDDGQNGDRDKQQGDYPGRHPAGKRSPQLPTPPKLVNEGAYPARGLDRSCSHLLSQCVKLHIEPPPFDAGILLVALLSLAAKGIGQPENTPFRHAEGDNVGRRAISGLR